MKIKFKNILYHKMKFKIYNLIKYVSGHFGVNVLDSEGRTAIDYFLDINCFNNCRFLNLGSLNLNAHVLSLNI